MHTQKVILLPLGIDYVCSAFIDSVARRHAAHTNATLREETWHVGGNSTLLHVFEFF